MFDMEMFTSDKNPGGIKESVRKKSNRLLDTALNLCTREDLEAFKRQDPIGFVREVLKLLPKQMDIDTDLGEIVKSYLIFETKKNNDTDIKRIA